MRLLCCFLFSIVFFVSCINDQFSVGNNLVTVNGRNVLIEDCTIELETQLGDSSVTSGLSRILTGRYNSPDFGTITAHSYFDFNPPVYSTTEFGANASASVRFDSISLILKYDTYIFGDTSKVQSIDIYKLQEIIELDDKNRLYTTSSFLTEADPWVSYRFERPKERWVNDTTLELRLPDAFGLELIDLMKSKSDSLDSYKDFLNYFKGIKISPVHNEDAAVNSFVLNSNFPAIRLYYTTFGVFDKEENTIDMTVNTGTAFSQIEADRSNTILQPLRYNNPLPSLQTGNKVYLQGLTGLYTKMSFPDLNEILKMGKNVIISSAILYVYPVSETYGDFTPLPANLVLNYLDESGKPMDLYEDSGSTTVQSGSLVESGIFEKKAYYAFDISTYLKYELGSFGMYKTSLQLTLGSTEKNGTLKSLVLGDSSFPNSDNQIKLIIYAIIYDNN